MKAVEPEKDGPVDSAPEPEPLLHDEPIIVRDLAGEEADTEDGSRLWSLEELVIEGTENGKLNRYVYAFGQDQAGELYVLTNTEFRPQGETGEVHKLVPAGEGDHL